MPCEATAVTGNVSSTLIPAVGEGPAWAHERLLLDQDRQFEGLPRPTATAAKGTQIAAWQGLQALHL